MWSARPSMKSRLHYIQALMQYLYALINGFVVYTVLTELAIFSWNMGAFLISDQPFVVIALTESCLPRFFCPFTKY